jgi:zinc transporter, ZIP family
MSSDPLTQPPRSTSRSPINIPDPVTSATQVSKLWNTRLATWLLVLVALLLALLAMASLLRAWNDTLQLALLGGLAAAGATAIGTLPVLLAKDFSQRTYDAMLGFGAGVMLAASSFSLVIPALAAARQTGAGNWLAGGTVGAGILLGAGLLLALDALVPHEHFVKGLEGARGRALKRVWLFVFAICLHNLPEGLAIGVAFAGPNAVSAFALATGIAIQDIPEGMVVALALRSVGYGKWTCAGLGVLSGLVEPIAAVSGAALVSLSAGLLPWGLAMAAGAIIPESHRKGHEALATGGLIVGFVVMMVLDTSLG